MLLPAPPHGRAPSFSLAEKEPNDDRTATRRRHKTRHLNDNKRKFSNNIISFYVHRDAAAAVHIIYQDPSMREQRPALPRSAHRGAAPPLLRRRRAEDTCFAASTAGSPLEIASRYTPLPTDPCWRTHGCSSLELAGQRGDSATQLPMTTSVGDLRDSARVATCSSPSEAKMRRWRDVVPVGTPID